MRRAIILQHLDREGPGTIADLCQQRGLRVDIARLDLGVPVPDTLTTGDVLVVMGGSMGIADTADPRHPFLAREVELLRRVLGEKQPVLAVCLGAQLLAHAAGSRVYPNQRPDAFGVLRPWREVGFGRVRLLGSGHEPALAGLPDTIPVLHWHGDTFDLPAGAVRLAENDVCANQAFRIGRRAFGLQFHVETDAPLVRAWAEEDSEFARSALGPGGPANIIAMCEEASREMGMTGERLIGNILGEMLGD
jgi:GMP synthase - Glutamine amidotransferase domain